MWKVIMEMPDNYRYSIYVTPMTFIEAMKQRLIANIAEVLAIFKDFALWFGGLQMERQIWAKIK